MLDHLYRIIYFAYVVFVFSFLKCNSSFQSKVQCPVLFTIQEMELHPTMLWYVLSLFSLVVFALFLISCGICTKQEME